ncbi:MAG: DUF927 domain-containing protein [Paracoccaceae bacterium]|uniref:DUF927 domain-containing protein n=1 Tax=Paracoccaceae TaxID=31989 RepID=UPI003297BB21
MNQVLPPIGLKPRRASDLSDNMEMVLDIPREFPRPKLTFRGNAPVDVYSYQTPEKKLVCLVARYEIKGKKSFLPFTVWQAPNGEMNWYMKGMAGNCPLFEAPRLLEEPDRPVIITEGEKCAIAAASAFPDYVCVTSMGGSGAIEKTNFSALAKRDVIIMPDNDAPGEKAAEAFAAKLRHAGAARIRRINISELSAVIAPIGQRAGFDVADAIEIGFDADCLNDLLGDPEMVTDVTADLSKLPDDKVLRELFMEYQIAPDLPYDFELNEHGIFKTEVDHKGNEDVIFVGSPLAVIGRTRMVGAQGGWGYLVVFKSPDGKWASLTLSGKLFANCGKELREALADGGFTPPQCLKGRRALSEYISFWKDCPIIQHTEQLGWIGNSFAHPIEIIQPKTEEKNVILSLKDSSHLLKQSGTIAGWLEIPRLAEQSTRATFAICTAFAAPLLRPLGLKGGGFHFSGQSSLGKTSLLMAAGAAYGGGSEDGFARTWTMTTNGAEGLVTGHNDILLPLDEMTKVTPEQAAEMIMMLANGQGKVRARKDGTSAPSQSWRVLFLSTGERTIHHQLSLAGSKTHMTGGVGVRIANIPIEISPGESFEACAPYASSRDLVKRLAELSNRHYGHAGPMFIRYLVDNPSAIDKAKVILTDQQAHLINPGDDPQVERVADRFALVCAAGLLAIEAGILPMQPSSVINAVTACFEAWKSQRGGNQSEEALAARRHLRHFFDVHGPSRFERLRSETDDAGNLRSGVDYPVRDRCGYRAEADDGAQVYYILPEAWNTEVCDTHAPQLMAKIAKDAGALELGEHGRPQKKKRLPDYPDGTRLYILRPDKLE